LSAFEALPRRYSTVSEAFLRQRQGAPVALAAAERGLGRAAGRGLAGHGLRGGRCLVRQSALSGRAQYSALRAGATHTAPSKYHDEIISLVFVHKKYGEPIVIMVFRRAMQKVRCLTPPTIFRLARQTERSTASVLSDRAALNRCTPASLKLGLILICFCRIAGAEIWSFWA
jgi:hypothetical protein